MSNFLDRFFPDKKNNNWNRNTNKSSNPIASFFNNIAGSSTSSSSFSGTGQSLGGNSKPGIVIPITLHEEGSLGIQIEKASSNQIAIVSMVIPNSQADKANIIRGDILCYPDTNGMEEIEYDIFLELAKSRQRPLSFDVRRIPLVTPSSSNGKRKGNDIGTSSATSTTTGSAGTKSTPANNTLSAEAFARKQAMIAAAEKREREHQKKYNTTSSSSSKSTTTLKPLLSTVEKNKLEQERQQRIQDQSKEIQAAATSNVEYVQQIKQMEQQTATQLGYNPYVSQSVSSGQARTAVTTTTHGTIQAPTTTTTKTSDHISLAGPGRVSAPASIPSADDHNKNNPTSTAQMQQVRPSIEFQQAFETLVTSTTDTSIVINTLTILRKLIINATTKGLNTATSDNEKYRKIRFMNNIKIRTSVTDIPGAIDILLSIGFQIHEEYNIELNDQESILLFPISTIVTPWLSTALLEMEQYIANHPTK